MGGGPTLSIQPHKGSLFKSHNNSAWAISPQEDMKFRLKRAVFDDSKSGTLTLKNNTLSDKRLRINPLTFTHGDTALKITHKDHGMYNTSNIVTITGGDIWIIDNLKCCDNINRNKFDIDKWNKL